MRLLHWTNKPQKELYHLLQKNKGGQIAKELFQPSKDTFLTSKRDQMDLIQSHFDSYSRARVTVSAPIVQNIVFSTNNPEEGGLGSLMHPSKDFDSVVGNGESNTQFKLTFATQGNCVYQIAFDRYFLK